MTYSILIGQVHYDSFNVSFFDFDEEEGDNMEAPNNDNDDEDDAIEGCVGVGYESMCV